MVSIYEWHHNITIDSPVVTIRNLLSLILLKQKKLGSE